MSTRNMDLIREILLKIEMLHFPSNGGYPLVQLPSILELEGDDATVAYQVRILRNGGLLLVSDSGSLLQGLSWDGHDFLDAIRDTATWEETRKAAEHVGGFTWELLRDLAKGLLKKKIEEHTGVVL
jgi:Hypothetical protein (DUF2513)